MSSTAWMKAAAASRRHRQIRTRTHTLPRQQLGRGVRRISTGLNGRGRQQQKRGRVACRTASGAARASDVASSPPLPSADTSAPCCPGSGLGA
jgi:hypothetical protein